MNKNGIIASVLACLESCTNQDNWVNIYKHLHGEGKIIIMNKFDDDFLKKAVEIFERYGLGYEIFDGIGLNPKRNYKRQRKGIKIWIKEDSDPEFISKLLKLDGFFNN